MRSEGKYRSLFYTGILAVFVLLLAAGVPALAQEKKADDTGQSSADMKQNQQGVQQKDQKQDQKSDQQQAQQKQTQTDQQQAQQKETKTDRYQTERKSGETARQQAGQTGKMTQYKPIVGREVRSSRGDEIGEVDNVVVSEDGRQVQAVVAVGGFLGMGEKKVLVSFDELQFQPASDFVVYRGTEQDLEQMAEYEEPEGRRRFADRPYYPTERWGYYGGAYPEGREPLYGDRGAYPEADRFGYRYPAQEDRFGRGYYERREGRFPYGEERFGGRYEDRYREDERYGRGYGPQRDDGRFYPRRDERSDRGSMMRERGMMGQGPMMRYDEDSPSSRAYGGRFEGRDEGRYFPPREGRYDQRYDERSGRQ